jgi:ligand-binding sensor domain-containing protein
VTDIIEDEYGLWLATYDSGVVLYDGTNWETWATDDELGGNNVDAIVHDGSGAVWFLHGGKGLTRYDPSSDDWQTFGEEEGALDWPSLPAVDNDGHVWIGGYGELKRYDGSFWQSFTPDQLADLVIFGIAIGSDNVKWLWLDEGLMRHDPATDEWTLFTAADHPALAMVTTAFVASDGTVWAGGSDGVIRYDGIGWSVPDASGDPPELVSGIAEAPDGSLWVVADGILYQLDGDQWRRFPWPGEGWAERVDVGPDGVVWVGYDGLGRFDPQSGAWKIYTTDDGLLHPVVLAIRVTPDGVVWVGTVGGVSRFVPEE